MGEAAWPNLSGYKLRHWPPGTSRFCSCRLFLPFGVQSYCCNGGVTVSTGSFAALRHAGVWAPVIARKTTIANNNLALAA